MKQLLVDYLPFMLDRAQLAESLNNSGKFVVTGVIQTADIVNRNGRKYPRAILEREIDKYVLHYINERRALGELDHPNSPVVNLQNTSHKVISVYWSGNDVMGVIEVLPTPSGNILRQLFESDIALGISSRGQGTIRYDAGVATVGEDFSLIAFDFVSNPSVREAIMRPINEGVNFEDSVYRYTKIDEIVTSILCGM